MFTSLFILSIVLMNFFAGKEITFDSQWIAMDCGILVSWVVFLYLDVVTRNFGPSAVIKITIFALVINIFVVLLFWLVAIIPGNWAQFYIFNNQDINTAINNTLKSNWYIIFGSSVAFFVSSVLNALLNQAIGKWFKKYSFAEFICRSYVSTLISQFIDNMIFALIVSYAFFGWSIMQCLVCSFIGCVIESLVEAVFCPFGYYLSEKLRNAKKSKTISKAKKE